LVELGGRFVGTVALLGRLLSLVLLFGVVVASVGSNFIIKLFGGVDVLDQLVHACDPIVVLLEALDLHREDTLFLVFHLKALFQTINVVHEGPVLFCELRVEVVLEVHVSSHVGHLAIPESKFISLHLVVGLHVVDTLCQISLRVVFVLDHILKLLYALLESSTVSLESKS
jgi:hypothetical protein